MIIDTKNHWHADNDIEIINHGLNLLRTTRRTWLNFASSYQQSQPYLCGDKSLAKDIMGKKGP